LNHKQIKEIAPLLPPHFQKPKIGEEYCALVIVAGMLGHSISILLTTYAHYIPTMQDQADQLMDDILTPVLIELISQS
jgi:hypothetical protein